MKNPKLLVLTILTAFGLVGCSLGGNNVVLSSNAKNVDLLKDENETALKVELAGLNLSNFASTIATQTADTVSTDSKTIEIDTNQGLKEYEEDCITVTVNTEGGENGAVVWNDYDDIMTIKVTGDYAITKIDFTIGYYWDYSSGLSLTLGDRTSTSYPHIIFENIDSKEVVAYNNNYCSCVKHLSIDVQSINAITYELNGGEFNGNYTDFYLDNKGLTLPTNVTKDGYIFAGWYDNEELTGDAVTAIGTDATGDKTYYVKWDADQVPVEEAIAKIDSIGEVAYTPTSKSLIDEAREAYDALNNDQKALVADDKLQILVSAEKIYETMRKIAAIGTVYYNNEIKTAIDDARTAYDDLTTDEKTKVTNYDTLTTAEDDYGVLEAKALINALGDAEYTKEFKAKLDAANDAFDALMDDLKDRVDNLNLLIIAQQEYDILNTTALIEAIGTVEYTAECKDKIDAAREAYDKLGKLQPDISNYSTLTAAEATYAVLEENYQTVQAVVTKINAIGSVKFTPSSKALIDEAREAYDALTPAQKAFVKDEELQVLVDAEVAYRVAEKIDAIGKVELTNESKNLIDDAREAYDNLSDSQTACIDTSYFQKLVDAEKVYEAMEKIDAIGKVNYDSDSKDAINEARKTYDSLTASQKEQLGKDYLNTLTKAEKKFSSIKAGSTVLVVFLLIFAISGLIGGAFFLTLLVLRLLKNKNNDDNDGQNGDNDEKGPVKLMSISGLLPFVILTNYYATGPWVAFYVIAGLTVLIWLSILGIILYEKYKNKKANQVLEEPEKEIKTVESLVNEDEEETVTVTDENGNIFNIRFVKSFTAKLIQSSDETKKYYEELKNEVLSYKKTNSRVSWHYDSINSGRIQVLKFAVRGKTLCVYYALNADDYADTKYKVEKAESKKYEDVPCVYRIKNDRRLGYAKELIAVVASNLGLEKGEEQHEVYSNLPYEPNKPLIDRGLIKELKVRVNKQEEVVLETKVDKDGDEIVTTKDLKGNIFEIRYVKSFTAKLSQSEDITKDYYSILKNYVLSYKRTNSRISWHYDSVNIGRNQVLKFAIRGKTLCVYYALNADDYADTKYKVEKVESKKFEDVPCMYRIKNDRRLNYAKDLIDELMNKFDAPKGKEVNDDYRIPFEDTKTLLKKGLIKEVKTKVGSNDNNEVKEELHSIDVAHADEMMTDEKAESAIEVEENHRRHQGTKEIINIDTLSKNFNDGDEVTLEALIKKKLVPSKTGYVKVLARGTLDKKLVVELDDFSLQAVKMIVLLGGHVKKIK